MPKKHRVLATFNFQPRFAQTLRGYSKAAFVSDLTAGVTVGVVALPLAMAFAIASGLKPEAGIFTAITAGFLVSALGGSRVQIGGPAGAFVVVVYAIVERYGVANLLLATMFAGVLLFAMGLFKLGTLVRYVPVSIVIGFTNGIAVLIALSQVKEFFGLAIDKMPADFFAKLDVIARQFHSVDPVTMALGATSLAILIFWPKLWAKRDGRAAKLLRRLPGTVVALVLATLAVSLFGLGVETIGSRFGGIPRALPSMALPDFDWTQVKQLFAPTITIALLGAIESLLCARVADSLIEDRHDPNQELMAQGIANFASPLLGGFCATGTIARTVTNVRAGARTPVAGIIHALTLLIIILAAAPLARDIPLATLAAILLFVAYHMGEWHEFARLRHFTNNYRIILLSTFLLTVVVDLTIAVEVGLVLACLFFITRIASLTRIEPIAEIEGMGHARIGVDIEAYRIFGSLFFAAVSKLEHLTDPKRPMPKVMILDMTHVLSLDTTGLDAIETLHTLLAKRGGQLIVCGLQSQADSLFKRSGFAAVLAADNVTETFTAALDRARAVLPSNAFSEGKT
jgi:sulfate permease, SulP family